MQLTPYLIFDGQCEAAINFYKKVFDGETSYMSRFSEGPMEIPDAMKDRIMHTTLNFKGISIMASDSMERATSDADAKGTHVQLSLNFDSKEELTGIFHKLKEGGEVTMPPEDTFWGDYFGMLTDKFGINWMLSCPK